MDVYCVMIECPNTGRATPTGHELSDLSQFKYLGLLPETTRCEHCHEPHNWTQRDAWITRQNASRVDVPAAWASTSRT
jgi:hypothetical protein